MKLKHITLTQTGSGEIIDRNGWNDINDNFMQIENELALALQFIDTGAEPNDGTGDTIQKACEKVNANFAKIQKAINNS